MNTTKHDSLVVLLSACLSSDQLRRPRASAISMAPSAPIAPPSVGVATPRKIVPSTRKISSSGGISTKVIRSLMRDSRPRRVILFSVAITKASVTPTHSETTMVSSRGTLVTGWPLHQLWTSAMCMPKKTAEPADTSVSSSSEGMPLEPLGSRKVRASSGSAGTQAGLMKVSKIT